MIPPWVAGFTLVLARVATFVAIMPIFGNRAIPRVVKAGMSFSIAMALFDFSAAAAMLGPSADFELSWLTFGLALARESLLAACVAFTLGLLFVPARIAGEFITQQMGLALAATVNPTAEGTNGPITQLLELLAMLLFLGLDGHHLLLAVLYGSFVRWPPGGTMAFPDCQQLVAAASQAGEWGVMLAVPVAVCLFLSSVVLALMARTAPQMNVFSVGFALQAGVGLAGLMFMLPEMVTGMSRWLGHYSAEVLGSW